MQVGDKLKNGASVLAFKGTSRGNVVLAVWGRPDSYHPYVTWLADKEWNTYTGHYYKTLAEAEEDFNGRNP